MSTNLINEEDHLGFYLCRFYGGEERGTCYQITNDCGAFVQLTKAQMAALVKKIAEETE